METIPQIEDLRKGRTENPRSIRGPVHQSVIVTPIKKAEDQGRTMNGDRKIKLNWEVSVAHVITAAFYIIIVTIFFVDLKNNQEIIDKRLSEHISRSNAEHQEFVKREPDAERHRRIIERLDDLKSELQDIKKTLNR